MPLNYAKLSSRRRVDFETKKSIQKENEMCWNVYYGTLGMLEKGDEIQQSKLVSFLPHGAYMRNQRVREYIDMALHINEA